MSEVSMQQLATGATPPKRAAKNKRIEELKSRFTTNAISLEEYVRGLAGHTNVNM